VTLISFAGVVRFVLCLKLNAMIHFILGFIYVGDDWEIPWFHCANPGVNPARLRERINACSDGSRERPQGRGVEAGAH